MIFQSGHDIQSEHSTIRQFHDFGVPVWRPILHIHGNAGDTQDRSEEFRDDRQGKCSCQISFALNLKRLTLVPSINDINFNIAFGIINIK